MRIRAGIVFVVAALVFAAIPSYATTFTVTKTADTNDGTCDGDCSLREAIVAANANPGADVIVLGSGLTYTLTLGPADAPGALVAGSGDLDITDSVTITGNGSTISGGALDRVFDIQGNITVTMNSVTITAGSAAGALSLGGGISIRNATVSLNNCTITGNSTAVESSSRDDGGGIAAIGSFDAATGTATLAHLTLSGTTVTNNHGNNGGGILCALCALSVSNSTISANAADGDGGGIDVVGTPSTLTMTGSNLVSNSATRGGGLAVPFGSSVVTLAVSRIVNNAATTGSALFNNVAIVSANDNWWGCSYGPGIGGSGCGSTPNAISGTAAVSRYLVLNVSAAPPTIPLGGTSAITADLTVNSLGTSTTSSGTIPNGTLAAFSGTRGTFATPSSTTTNGKATDVYTATGPKGTATVNAIVDGQTATTTLNVGYQAFTDDPIVAGVTVVKAVHVTELRTRINTARVAHGLGTYPFSALAAGTVIQAQHITELRTALAQVYTAMLLTQPAYTDPSLSAGTVVKALHISQLRAALIVVE